VGSPYQLVYSLGVGVKAFFVEPAQAIINNPTDLEKIGLAAVKGTVALVSKTTDGIIGTGTTITRSVGRGIAKLSMDDIFTHQREELQRQPITAIEAFFRPIKDLNNGFYCGIVGLARVPARSYRAHGVSGLLPGIVKGVEGLPTKIVVGALDAITHSGDAIRQGVKAITKTDVRPVSRWRLSGLFGPDGRVLPYSYTIALGTHTLRIMNMTGLPTLNMNGDGIPNGKRMSLVFWQKNISAVPFRGTKPSMLPYRRSSARSSISEGGRQMIGDISRSMFTSNLFTSNVPEINEDDQVMIDLEQPSGVEFVVHTAMIQQEIGVDRLVILSTKRLVVTDYKRSTAGALLIKRWEAELDDLLDIELEKSGGKASLTIKAGKSTISQMIRPQSYRSRSPSISTNHQRGLESSEEITSQNTTRSVVIHVDYQREDTLVILNNCICTLLHRPNNFFDPEKESPEFLEEEDSDVIHIGPWKYDLSEDLIVEEAFQLQNRQRKLIEDLQMERWVVTDEDANDFTRVSGSTRRLANQEPAWLIEERRNAVMSHSLIAEVTKILQPENSKNLDTRMTETWPGELYALDLLQRNLMSYEEYEEMKRNSSINEVKQYFEGGRPLNSNDQNSRKGLIKSDSHGKLSIFNSSTSHQHSQGQPRRRSFSALRIRAANWFKHKSQEEDPNRHPSARPPSIEIYNLVESLSSNEDYLNSPITGRSFVTVPDMQTPHTSPSTPKRKPSVLRRSSFSGIDVQSSPSSARRNKSVSFTEEPKSISPKSISPKSPNSFSPVDTNQFDEIRYCIV
jgi:hypothetical protein